MKESEAWKILAEEHDAGRTHTPFLCISLGNPEAASIWHNAAVATIPAQMRRDMIRRITGSVGHFGSAYSGEFEMPGAEKRDARVLACLMLSEQAKEEER